MTNSNFSTSWETVCRMSLLKFYLFTHGFPSSTATHQAYRGDFSSLDSNLDSRCTKICYYLWYHLQQFIFINSGCAALCLVAQSCMILCNSMDCSPPGSSVHSQVGMSLNLLEKKGKGQWSMSRVGNEENERRWVSESQQRPDHKGPIAVIARVVSFIPRSWEATGEF